MRSANFRCPCRRSFCESCSLVHSFPWGEPKRCASMPASSRQPTATYLRKSPEGSSDSTCIIVFPSWRLCLRLCETASTMLRCSLNISWIALPSATANPSGRFIRPPSKHCETTVGPAMFASSKIRSSVAVAWRKARRFIRPILQPRFLSKSHRCPGHAGIDGYRTQTATRTTQLARSTRAKRKTLSRGLARPIPRQRVAGRQGSGHYPPRPSQGDRPLGVGYSFLSNEGPSDRNPSILSWN